MRFVYFLSPVFTQGKVKVIKRGLKISKAVNRGRTDNTVFKRTRGSGEPVSLT